MSLEHAFIEIFSNSLLNYKSCFLVLVRVLLNIFGPFPEVYRSFYFWFLLERIIWNTIFAIYLYVLHFRYRLTWNTIFAILGKEVWTQATQVDISVLPPCRSAAKRYLHYFTKSSKSKKRNKKQSRNNAFGNKIWNNNSKICNII